MDRRQRIRFLHRAAGLASPTDQRVVRDLLEGARRQDAGRDHGREAITAKRLAAALASRGWRRRRSPSAIARSYCSPSPRDGGGPRSPDSISRTSTSAGLASSIITIRKSKTDQGGAGQFVAVPRLEHGPCAVAAVEAWLAIREQKKGLCSWRFRRSANCGGGSLRWQTWPGRRLPKSWT